MSISSSLAGITEDRLVIPYPGKMFRSSVSKTDKATCFVLNKGYIESDSLDQLKDLLNDADAVGTIVRVGNIEQVITLSGEKFRQRLFFKSIRHILNVVKLNGFSIYIPPEFRVTINSVMNCLDDLKYFEYYARFHKVTIDEWLTNCLLIHLHCLLKYMGILSPLDQRVEEILRGKKGYLDRAPFLISGYNIDDKSSAVFLEMDGHDSRLYSNMILNMQNLNYGFTTSVVAQDKKEGVFTKR